jgi:hypothetical protein
VSYGTPGGEYGQECRAAIVTQVQPNAHVQEIVGLCVLNPSGMFFNVGVRHDGHPPALRAGGTWHWPEREETT